MEPIANVHFVFIVQVSMESIDVHSSALNVKDVTPHDVELGYYCPRPVDHLEVNPFHILTSYCAKNEMQLARVGGAKAMHDVGSF